MMVGNVLRGFFPFLLAFFSKKKSQDDFGGSLLVMSNLRLDRPLVVRPEPLVGVLKNHGLGDSKTIYQLPGDSIRDPFWDGENVTL